MTFPGSAVTTELLLKRIDNKIIVTENKGAVILRDKNTINFSKSFVYKKASIYLCSPF